jgi:hypothetical protein
MNNLDFVKQNLYVLKRSYGAPADLYHIVSMIQDPRIGTTITQKVKYHIKRAILLPTTLQTYLNPQGAYTKPGTDTPAGLTIGQKLIIIDNRDLPKDFDIDLKDYLVINRVRYDIKSSEQLEHRKGTLLVTKQVTGQRVDEIFDVTIKQKLIINQSAVGTL